MPGNENASPRSHCTQVRNRAPAAVIASLVAGFIAVSAVPSGALASQMALHIFYMNAIAPALALLAISHGARIASGRTLVSATVLQLTLLWGWHAPPAFSLALSQLGAHAVMHISLFITALCFWFAVFSDGGIPRWRGIFALLVTSKLFCLLGALLVLAPRPLYSFAFHGHGATDVEGMLADQRLAGLLMLVACPFTYVAAGVAMAAKWLRDLAAISAEALPVSNSSNVSAASS